MKLKKLNIILFSLSAVYLGIVIAYLLAQKQLKERSLMANKDAEFISYMLRAIPMIERKKQEQKMDANLPNNAPNSLNDSQLPTVANLPIPLPPAPPLQPQNSNPLDAAKSPPTTFNYTLMGLMASGETSQAIFDINGATQSIQVGKPIGSSNWIVRKITPEQVIIEQNGKQVSLSVGQKF